MTDNPILKALERTMADMELMFHMPRVIKYPSGEIEIVHHWTNPKAEKIFDTAQEMYAEEIKKMSAASQPAHYIAQKGGEE